MENIEYRILDVTNKAELEQTAQLAAKAMCVDSAWSYIFGRAVVEPLAWLLTKQLILTAGTTTIGVDATTKKVMATITMKPPHKGDATLWEMIRVGVLLVPIHYGWGPLRRILESSAFFGKLARPDAWTVNLMAVTPTMQGRGVGTRLLAHELSKVSAEEAVCLDTQAERNLRFYGKQGFKIVKKHQFFGDSAQPLFYSWAMVREPANEVHQAL